MTLNFRSPRPAGDPRSRLQSPCRADRQPFFAAYIMGGQRPDKGGLDAVVDAR